jgi:CheY-like chemotaxis protein
MTTETTWAMATMPSHPPSHATPLILCVDDDPDILSSIELRLRSFDVRFARAFFGMQGLQTAVTHRPDLIIMDLAMPGGNGQYMLECLKRNQRTTDIPVIVLTAMCNRQLRKHVFELGAASYLRKPIRFDDLLHEISRFVDVLVCEDDPGRRDFAGVSGTPGEQLKRGMP